MKLFISILTLLGFLIVVPATIKAEGTTTELPQTTEAPVTTEAPTTQAPVTTEAPTTTAPVVTDSETPDDDETTETKDVQTLVTEIAQEYLGEYFDKQLIANVVTVIFGVLGYVGFVITNLKYRKYKNETTGEVKTTIVDELNVHFNKAFELLSDEKIKPLIEQNEELKKGYETIMKVLVLMQDATASGKVALIEYLGSKTNSQEVKEASEQVTEKIEQEEANKKEITEKVSGEYKDIF